MSCYFRVTTRDRILFTPKNMTSASGEINIADTQQIQIQICRRRLETMMGPSFPTIKDPKVLRFSERTLPWRIAAFRVTKHNNRVHYIIMT
jgi:hypothetical protein